MDKFDIEKVKAFINRQSKSTKIYVGTDSYRFKKKDVWWSRHTTVVVVHINGKNGCKIFGNIETERDYDSNKSRPINRMMSEVYKTCDMYLQLKEAIADREFEIHVDINPDPKHGSNVAYNQALGYIKGVCGINAVAKPKALASSFAADHFRNYEGVKEPKKAAKKELA